MISKVKIIKLILYAISIMLIMAITILSYRTLRWKAYIWLPTYILNRLMVEKSEISAPKHIIFIMVDHFEPGSGKSGADKTFEWIEKFKVISNQSRDSYGNKFRYSWFYPYDHHNEISLKLLADAVYNGYGEVNLHWHHPTATNDLFPGMLVDALKWYQGYGLLLSSGEKANSNFAFIHGSWGLDDSYEWISGGHPRRCGVRKELDILKSAGCYADFTFPSFGNSAQPRTVNSIYYAIDTPEPKSYDRGQTSSVGRIPSNQEFMLFQGPLGVDLLRLKFEYGAVESYEIPTKRRIEQWINSNIHVKGKPDWVFVKVYSHGMQSKEVILKEHMIRMLNDLNKYCNEKNYALHYMTAREAYNVVKAAENGQGGDPELYRDYSINKPCAAFLNSNMPIKVRSVSNEKVSVSVVKPSNKFRIKLQAGNVKNITGKVNEVLYIIRNNKLLLNVSGDVVVETTKDIKVSKIGNGRLLIRRTSK